MGTASSRPDSREQDLPSGQPRITVVDGNHDAADSLSALLRLLGYEACAVYDGFKALEKVDSFRPDVVVLDIGMPGMNGYELARQLRSLPALQCILIVAVTGYGQARDRLLSFEAGINYHVVKPLNIEVLLKLIEAHVARSS